MWSTSIKLGLLITSVLSVFLELNTFSYFEAEALAIKNQRDLQIQHEQDEKCRLANTVDGDIKRWAAGKEGNLRALLSSLQQWLLPRGVKLSGRFSCTIYVGNLPADI